MVRRYHDGNAPDVGHALSTVYGVMPRSFIRRRLLAVVMTAPLPGDLQDRRLLQA